MSLPIIPRVESLASTPWLGIIVLSMMMILLLVMTLNRHQYLTRIRNLTKSRARVMVYEGEQSSTLANVIMWIAIMVSYAIMCYALMSYMPSRPQLTGIHFIVTLGAISLLMGAKYFTFRQLGWVYNMKEKVAAYSLSYYIAITALGMVTLILSTGIIYGTETQSKIFIFIYLAIAAGVLGFIIFKAIQIFYDGIGSLFYIFLYLCSLEIMPLLLLTKVATMA